MPSAGLRRDERGFTLVELLMTMLILVVGVMGTVTLIDGANARTAVTAQREAGNALVREVIEDARSVPYAKLTPAGLVAELQSISGLGDIDADVAWKVKRRNVTYVLTATVCSVDDGKDDFGDHGGGNFCPGPSTPTPPNDRSPDDYKRLKITASWKRPGGGPRSVSQSAVISNESNSTGPDLAFVSQEPGGLGSTQMNDSSVTSIVFGVETSAPAAAVKYQVDGVTWHTDTPGGTSSSFTWQIDNGPKGHLPDGTYVISARAYDDQGHAGPTRSRTLRLNRDIPLAPIDFKGGWNALRGIVDLEWNRNSEPDVIGYRVYRDSASGGTELVCEYVNQAAKTDCIDLTPPKDAGWVYYAVALDEDPFDGSPREGEKSAVLTVTRSDDRPKPPEVLTARADGGDVVLDWTVPADGGYAGGAISFYRIYRNGTGIADRHAIRSPGNVTSYTDGGAAAEGNKYWITAVDENFSESDPVGPVALP